MINTAYKTPTKKEFDRVVKILREKDYEFPNPKKNAFELFGKETIVHCESNKMLSVGFVLGDGFRLKTIKL